MSRRQARETAFKVLFQVDIGKQPWQDALFRTADDDGVESRDREFLYQLVSGTMDHLQEIDDRLASVAIDWKIDRMLSTDRNILRLATFELLHSPDVPASATINEAVEMAKAYGDDHSGKFVNGILGHIVRQESDPQEG